MHIKTMIGMFLPAALLSACATGPNWPELPAATARLAIDGASFAAPGEPGWYVPMQTPYHLGVTKLGKTRDETLAIEAQLYKALPAAPGTDFVRQIREGEDKDADPQRFTVQEHEVKPFQLGTATCADSHTLVEDKAAKTPGGQTADMLLEAYSLNCLHPDDARVGVNITYSQRYYPGNRDPQLADKAAALFASVHLDKLSE